MISLYLFLASVSLALLGYGVYQKGKKVVLESMGAIAIIDDENNAILFVSRDTKKKIPHNLDLFNSELDGKLISDYLSLPYQFRGKQCRLLCLSSDNSERPIYNKTDLSLIHTLIQSIPDAIGLTDHEMIYRACNQAFVNPLGIGSPEDLLGKKLEEVASKNISEKFALSDKRVLETGEAFRFIDEVNEPNGRSSWIDAHKFRYINPSTNQYGLFILARDVTEAELLKKELNEARDNYKKLSMVDALTQISNRRMFDEHLQAEWKNHTRNGKPMSLMLCDVDEFKKLNDFYGHIYGDNVLSIIAKSLASLVTKPQYSVFRYGGEEFAFILSTTDEKHAQEFAVGIHTTIALLFEKYGISNVDGKLTVSVGVYTCIPTEYGHSTEALQLVDEALYKAKGRGRNQTVYIECQRASI